MDIVRFQKQMLDWFSIHARIMPWRNAKTPYRVWISEVMLQQTRVDTVIPYFERFLERFPTLESLAGAEEEALLKAWEGLGYYHRVRNLQKAAKMLLVNGGTYPQTAEGWETLPGIGPYASGSIASIAFECKVPAVDGNVLRVLARVDGFVTDCANPASRKHITELARTLLPNERIGDFNQSLMELGALICLPNGKPKCESCPIRDLCEAYRLHIQDQIPPKTKKTVNPEEEMTVLLLENERGFALRKRPEKGLLAGLWEFPNFPGSGSESDAVGWAEAHGFQVSGIRSVGTYTHVFSHKTWKMTGYHLSVEGEGSAWIFVTPAVLHEEMALPTAFRAFQTYVDSLK